MNSNQKNENTNGWQGFNGGLRIHFNDGSYFDLTCGGGRRYPSGKLDEPIEVDPYQCGRLRELLAKCEQNDTLKHFVMRYDGNDRKSLLLSIETDRDEAGVKVDGVAVRKIKKLFLPSCIYEGLEKVIGLCVS